MLRVMFGVLLLLTLTSCSRPLPEGIRCATNPQITIIEYLCNYEYMTDKQMCYATDADIPGWKYFDFVYAPIFSKKTGKFEAGIIFAISGGNDNIIVQSLNDALVWRYCSVGENDTIIYLFPLKKAKDKGIIPVDYSTKQSQKYLTLQDFAWSIERDILKEQKD